MDRPPLGTESSSLDIFVTIAIRYLLEDTREDSVQINSYLRSMGPSTLSESKNDDLQLDIYFRQSWTDLRLQFVSDHISAFHFNWRIFDKIWTPDTVFSNSRNAFLHKVSVPNRSERKNQSFPRYFSHDSDLT